MNAGQTVSMSELDLELCVSVIMKEWTKRYKKKYKFEYDFRAGDVDRLKEMVKKWGYDKAFIVCCGAIRFYADNWRTEVFKWLTVNQVHTWIGEEVWKMYLNKEFTVKIIRPIL